MTDETDLLPLPEWMSNYTIPADGFECDKDVMLVDRMHDYARANVAHATAPLQAEIDVLRAEVERLRRLVQERDTMLGKRLCSGTNADGKPRCLVLAEERALAERLAEALALLPDEIVMVEHNPYEGPLMFCCGQRVTLSWHHGLEPTHNNGCWYARMRAMRDHDQEARND